MFQHCTVCWVNADGAKGEINRTINVANRICRNHLALNDCEKAYIKRAAMLLCPRLKRNLNAERPKVRVEEIVNLIDPCSTSHRIKRAS